MPLQESQTIRRKDRIPDDLQTPGKDDVANYIQTEIIDVGRWPMHATEIEEEVDYSRQHISNTLRDYFVAVESDEQPNSLQIDIPDGVDRESYIQGWINGYTAE